MPPRSVKTRYKPSSDKNLHRVMTGVNAKTEQVSVEDLPEVLTVAEVARWLKVDAKTVYVAIEDGDFPARRIGRRRLVVLRDALVEWLAKGDRAAPKP